MLTKGRTLYDTIVYINVGPAGDVRQHGIHRGLISQYSTYFKTCLESGFKESHEKVGKVRSTYILLEESVYVDARSEKPPWSAGT